MSTQQSRGPLGAEPTPRKLVSADQTFSPGAAGSTPFRGPSGAPAPTVKLAVLLREDLPVWQRLNVTAFLVSGLASAHPELIGEPYLDADDTEYLPMFGQPLLVFAGSKETLTAAHGKALARGWTVSIFTSELFHTGNDRDNRAAVRGVPSDALDLVGLAVHGPRNAVDKVLKGASLHS